MKKNLLLFTMFLSFISCSVFSQMPQLWGMTLNGGANSKGYIFKMNLDGSNFTNVHDFSDNTGTLPNGSLIKGADGILYGTTTSGGDNGDGVIFSYNMSTSAYTALYSFNHNSIASGNQPWGTLLWGVDNKLWGTTANGGANSDGIIYNFDPVSKSFNDYTDFTGITAEGGASPTTFGSLFQRSSDGELYGVTNDGGPHDGGVIYRIGPSGGSASYHRMHEFDSTGGAPRTGLIDFQGSLVGTCIDVNHTTTGGILFSIDYGGTAYNILHNFAGGTSDGAEPMGIFEDPVTAVLYGLTMSGGTNNEGIIFEYVNDQSGVSYNVLTNFNGNTGDQKGGAPRGSLIKASNGKLYGMTYEGGLNNTGTAFSLDINNGNTFTKIHDFGGEGANPTGALLEIQSITGVNDILMPITNFNVLPNPVTNQATIMFSTEIPNKYTLELTDLLGQVILERVVYSSAGQNKVYIDINDKPNGMYFINIKSQETFLSALKFLKQ